MEFLKNFDKQKLQRITLILIAALTLLALVLLLVIIISSVEGNSGSDGFFGNNHVQIEYENLTVEPSHLNNGSLLVINNSHKYEIPTDLGLVLISEYRNTHDPDLPYIVEKKNTMMMEVTALESAHKMLCDMGKSTKNDDIMITSAFRSYDEQTNVPDKTFSAGHTDHHSGMLISLKASNNSPLADENLTWLDKNAHKYGFVMRYPGDKAAITGVSDYTQAYRYVGAAHAKYMVENNLCLEEYVEYLKKNTSHSSTLSVKTDDGSVYYVYYTAAAAGDTVKVPAIDTYSYTISGTNEGGVVITVKVK